MSNRLAAAGWAAVATGAVAIPAVVDVVAVRRSPNARPAPGSASNRCSATPCSRMHGEDDEPCTTEADDSWYPPAQAPDIPEVDWSPPEHIGALWLPAEGGGFELEQYHENRVFGFARWLDEKGD